MVLQFIDGQLHCTQVAQIISLNRPKEKNLSNSLANDTYYEKTRTEIFKDFLS